jgi:hypothetical protein
MVAVAFESSRPAGRVAIGLGGLGVLIVAAEPLPQNAFLHGIGAFIAFVSLAIWPVLGLRARDSSFGPWSTMATTVFVVLLLWVEFASGYALGLAERLLAGGEILWVSGMVLAHTGSDRG